MICDRPKPEAAIGRVEPSWALVSAASSKPIVSWSVGSGDLSHLGLDQHAPALLVQLGQHLQDLAVGALLGLDQELVWCARRRRCASPPRPCRRRHALQRHRAHAAGLPPAGGRGWPAMPELPGLALLAGERCR
ncbi:MAG: hypothetical protein KIT58_02915 [Planctomycetota bacterium]|nr:hypothetical protein [Planctomycetota bacterium]